MEDYLIRVITETGNIRGLAASTTGLVDEICRRHGTFPTAAVALGRAVTGGVLMGALLKTDQRLALKFEGNGPLRKIVVEADSDGTVRGYVAEPEVELPLRDGKVDVPGALGKAGLLTVTKDLGLKEPYHGIVHLYTSEIAEDLAYFFTESEQTPSAVGLSVFVAPEGITAAGGFLIQSLPPSDDETVSQIIRQIQKMPSVAEMLQDGRTPEDMLHHIFSGIPIRMLERRPVRFSCSCSAERVENALITLGRDELQTIRNEQGQIDITCKFCGTPYVFNKKELERLIDEMKTYH